MKVFLSWSGARSKYLAESLRGWLRKALQSVQPWMSNEDIAAGSRWLAEVSFELNDAKVGILCVVPENQVSPWLLFEAGALSKTLDQTYVCPLLYEMNPGQLSGPITQFQATTFNNEGMLKLLQMLNQALGDNSIPETALADVLRVWWPELEELLSKMPPATEPEVPQRAENDMLEEILEISREQLRRENIRLKLIQSKENGMEEMIEGMQPLIAAADNMEGVRAKLAEQFPKELLSDYDPKVLLEGLDPDSLRKAMSALKDISAKGQFATEQLLNPPNEK